MGKKRNKAGEIALTLENVRCFDGAHSVPIRPLTLLVGENSTGKTTVLAAASLAFDQSFPMGSDFNKPPFQLGSFDTVATYKAGRYGRADSFSIGRAGVPRAKMTFKATFVERAGEPVVSSISIADAGKQMEVVIDIRKDAAIASVKCGERTEMEQKFPGELARDLPALFTRLLVSTLEDKGKNECAGRLMRLADALGGYALGPGLGHRGGSPLTAVAMAPIRSKPERTYSEMSSASRPEGGHVPFLLSKLSGGEEAGGDKVDEELASFGNSSGLFEEVKPKRFGRKPSDPFQIQVKAGGPAANLVDVGYGVSQVLPILVDSVTAPRGALVLIQQPEVHLHPRAQAALGSFLVHLAAEEARHLVIETHSDYIIDRVRMEVADGKIAPDDVALLYFEKEHVESSIHRIAIDKLGNLVDAPPTYGNFFLREAAALVTGKR